MTIPSWHPAVPILEDRWLALLAQQLDPAPEPEPEPGEWMWDEVYQLFADGNLVFSAPGCVRVAGFIGETAACYPWLAAVVRNLNGQFAEHPGAVLVPLTPAQVEVAQRALDAGLLVVDESWNYFHTILFHTSIGGNWGACDRRNSQCYVFGEPFDLHRLARAVDHALDALMVQQPDGGHEKSLQSVAYLLAYCRQLMIEEES